ncbi:MAG TPA: hypothetical protein VLL54_21820 [Pyrinomonadaceae bacterium]|nr:hypothetical protein [Pyrinomonadaceae bacterium]
MKKNFEDQRPQTKVQDPETNFHHLIFHPLSVLLLSVSAALVYAGWVRWRFGGDQLGNQLVYVVPIVVPFVAFLLDRAHRIGVWRPAIFLIDFVVVGTSILRVIGNVPYVSGHSFFLTYAILGPGARITKITAALVMVEVIYLKYFVWHDFITSSTGILLGAIAAVLAHRFRPK